MREKKKYYTACRDCEGRAEGFGKCKFGFDNWYIRKTKKNGCPKCEISKRKRKGAEPLLFYGRQRTRKSLTAACAKKRSRCS